MIKITKWPVIVIANYRTGSTEFSHNIFSRHNNCKWFAEPHYNESEVKELQSCINNNDKKFVLKIMVDQLEYFPEYKLILNSNSTLIRLRRKNLIDNIVSYYIARKTNKWTPSTYQGLVNLDYNLIDESISRIQENNNALDKLTYSFDYDLYYEDIIFQNSLQHKNFSIANEKRLKEIIKNRLINN